MPKPHKRIPKRRARFNPWFVVAGLGVAVASWSVWRLRASVGPSGAGQPISRLQTQDFHSLAFSPEEPDTVYFGHHGGLLVSRDGGRKWQPTSLQNVDAMALAAPPSDPQIRYAAGHNVFLKSVDGGQTWQSVGSNLPGLDIHGFAVDPDRSDLVYAHVVGFGLFRSEDAGEIWELRSTNLAAVNLAVGETAETIYATGAQSGLLLSIDGGRTWSPIPGPIGEGALAVSFHRPTGRLYVTTFGRGGGLYLSSDAGETWQTLGLKANLLAVAVSPHDPGRLIAVDDQGWVYASHDAGVTWSNQ